MALLNALVAFNPISGSYWMYAAIGVVAVIALIFLVFVKKEIVYVDPDTDYEIAHEKYGWGKKINVASAGKTGRKFVGWSYDEDGEKRLGKKTIRLFRTTELFAVWEKPVVGITIEEANAVVEFIYIDDATGKEIVKQICPLSINVPDEVEGKQILGWAFEPSQGPLVTASDNDKSVLTLELYPVREGWDSEEAVEETAPVVEEPVVEETVEEVVEEPVAEETVEEVVEEPVAEEVAEEAPAEEPVVAIEAPVPSSIFSAIIFPSVPFSSKAFFSSVEQSLETISPFSVSSFIISNPPIIPFCTVKSEATIDPLKALFSADIFFNIKFPSSSTEKTSSFSLLYITICPSLTSNPSSVISIPPIAPLVALICPVKDPSVAVIIPVISALLATKLPSS